MGSQLNLGVRRLHQASTTWTMRPQTVSERRATRLYARAAWMVLALILLSFAMYLPAANSALSQLGESSAGRLALTALLLGGAVATLTLWVAALWYVWVSSEVLAYRPLLVAMLIVTHVVGAFIYYWCAVHWRAGTRMVGRPGGPANVTA